MLPDRYRLRSSSDIAAVVRQGRSFTTPAVRVCYRPGVESSSRFACVVSKKVAARAVDRHALQRWLRVIAAEILEQHLSTMAYDVVFVARPALRDVASLDELRAMLVPVVQQRLR